MAFYKAMKLCRFAGQEFRIGEYIPEELIAKGAIRRLKDSGKIAVTAEGPLLPSADTLEGDEDKVDGDTTGEGTGETVEIPEEGLASMEYNDLKELAKQIGVSAKGKKDELIARIAEAIEMSDSNKE